MAPKWHVPPCHRCLWSDHDHGMAKEPTQGEVLAHRDEGYRALGRYVSVFSMLVYEMRAFMQHHLAHADQPPMVAWFPFAEATAQPIANAFFAMCAELRPTKTTRRRPCGSLDGAWTPRSSSATSSLTETCRLAIGQRREELRAQLPFHHEPGGSNPPG